MPGAKSAYQRKHMLPRAQKVDENPTTTDAERRPSLTEDHGGIISGGGGGGVHGKTWAKKRKEHLLARSGVTRAEGEETATAAIITDAAPPSKPKAPAGKSWEQKRKENLLTRMKPRGNDADIGLKAVVFVTRLRRLSNSQAASPELYPLPQPRELARAACGRHLPDPGGRYAGSSGRLVAKVAAMDADDGEMAFARLATADGRSSLPHSCVHSQFATRKAQRLGRTLSTPPQRHPPTSCWREWSRSKPCCPLLQPPSGVVGGGGVDGGHGTLLKCT